MAALATPQRVAVFRALQLGDLLCAVPALRALRHAWPQAQITLIGLPWAKDFADRLPYVDDFVEFPGFPLLPERTVDLAGFSGFLADMQARRFSLAIQMHGDGKITNSLVAAFGANQRAGFFHPQRDCPNANTFIPWPEHLSEIHSLLSLATFLGAPHCGDHLELPIRPEELVEFRQLRPELPSRPYVCIHPGARLATRRWPPERFARVADGLAADGYAVVLTGTSGEKALCAAVAAAMQNEATDFCGRTSLGALACLVAKACLVVCNDTGMSHIAAAMRTPSVVACCGADPQRWRPLDVECHRVLAIPVACRPCFGDTCPTGHECAMGLASGTVLAEARRLLRSTDHAPCPSPDPEPVQ